MSTKKWRLFLIVLIFLGALVVRLYRFNGPIADWHSWRQADTSSVARNFIKFGFDLLHPRIDNISNVQTNGAFENPKGYFFAEFPLYNFAQAVLFATFHVLTLEEWGRLVTIFSSLSIMLVLYLLCRKYANTTVAILSIFFYAFLPFSIYYSRTILPQSSALAALFGSIYFFDTALSKDNKRSLYFFGLLSVGLCAASILMSPYVLFYVLPYLYLLYKKWGRSLFLHVQPYAFLFFALLPFVLWRIWMLAYPEGIPADSWVFNGANIRFTGAFFYWIFADRLVRLILGYYGIILLFFGLVAKRRNYGFFLSFLLGSLLFITIVAAGNVQHDYYQLLIIPSIAIFLALGTEVLFKMKTEIFNTLLVKSSAVVFVVATLAFSWYFVRDYFNINNPEIITAGKAVDQLTPKNAKILTFYNGDSTFLYQTNRQGWASLEKPIDQIVSMGADYLVILDPTANDKNGLGKQYRPIAATPTYMILDLHHSP